MNELEEIRKRKMEKLKQLYNYAWDTFYADGGYQTRMGELFFKVIKQEILDGTYRKYNPREKRSFKKAVNQ